MQSFVLRLMQVLRLTRVSQGFAATANLWFVILWTRAEDAERLTASGQPVLEQPLWLLLLGGLFAGAGLYAFGAVANDMLDVHRDRALRRDRPIASGRVSGRGGVIGLTLGITSAVAGSTVFGTAGVLIALAVAFVVLLFNLFGKFVPAIGLLLLCVIYAGHLLTPNHGLRFLWPAWVVMTHAVSTAALNHALERKSPPLSARAMATAAVGWAAFSAGLLALGASRGSTGETLEWWPSWVGWTGVPLVIALAVGYIVTVVRRIRRVGPGARAAEKITRYGALWLPLYGLAWLLGEGHFVEATILAGLWLAALVGMTVLREAYGLAEEPIGFRR